jgi:hypothetical protein
MKNDFDCLKMKEDIYSKIYSETKHMNLKEYVEYITQSVTKSKLWRKFEKNDDFKLNDGNSANKAIHKPV